VSEPRVTSRSSSNSDASPSLPKPPGTTDTPPTVRRRLAALLYEALLLFGVVFVAGYLFSTLTQQRNGLTHHNLAEARIFAGNLGLA